MDGQIRLKYWREYKDYVEMMKQANLDPAMYDYWLKHVHPEEVTV